MTGATSTTTARPDGVVLVAVWFIINTVLALLGALAIAIFALPAVTRDTVGDDRYFAVAAVSFGLVLIVVFGVLDLITAVGLLRLRDWARWLAIVLAAMGLLAFPVGTIVGGFIIWYLLGDEAKRAFGTASPPAEQVDHTAAATR
jgi:uncharacterized membrane protein (DUF2068 family)